MNARFYRSSKAIRMPSYQAMPSYQERTITLRLFAHCKWTLLWLPSPCCHRPSPQDALQGRPEQHCSLWASHLVGLLRVNAPGIDAAAAGLDVHGWEEILGLSGCKRVQGKYIREGVSTSPPQDTSRHQAFDPVLVMHTECPCVTLRLEYPRYLLTLPKSSRYLRVFWTSRPATMPGVTGEQGGRQKNSRGKAEV